MVPWLSSSFYEFPPIETALDEPNGLLAAGGDLSPARIIEAYTQGIFPWFNDDEPILWWSPAPRCVLKPQDIHVSKSLAKCIRKEEFSVTFDECFLDVIKHCSSSRKDKEGTWITENMIEAYSELFSQGYCHSVEVWNKAELVGGLYGIAIGSIFYGESMFSYQANASKVAFQALANKLDKDGFTLIDCQVHSPHLESMGAKEIDRKEFREILEQSHRRKSTKISYWSN